MRINKTKIRGKLAPLIMILVPLLGGGCLSVGMAAQWDELKLYKQNAKVDYINALVTDHRKEEDWYGIIDEIKDISYVLGSCVHTPQPRAPSFETLHSIGQAYQYASQNSNPINRQNYLEEGRLFFTYCASIFPYTKISNNVQAIGYMWLDFFLKSNSFQFEGGLTSYKNDVRKKALMLDETIGDFFDESIKVQQKIIEAQQHTIDIKTAYFDPKIIKAQQKISLRRRINIAPIDTRSSQIFLAANKAILKIEPVIKGNRPFSYSPFSPKELERMGGSYSPEEEGKSSPSPLPGCLSEPNQDVIQTLKDQLNVIDEGGGE